MANQVYQDRTPVTTSSMKPLMLKAGLAVALPGAGIGTTVFTVFAITNWAMLVAISPMIIEAGFVLLGLTVATVVLGLMIKLVLAPSVALLGRSAHGTVDLIERIQYTRGTLTRNKVLYTGPDYAIIEGKGGHPEIISIEHTRRNISTRIKEDVEIEAAEEMPALPPAKSGRELLTDGTIMGFIRQGLIVLGYVNGTLKTMKLANFFSAIIAGLPSSGKTTTVFWLVIQLILHKIRLIVIDPHMHYQSEDGRQGLAQELAPFSDWFLFPPCDDDDRAIWARIRWMATELVRRKKPGYVARVSDTVICIIDEFNSVAERLGEEFASAVAELEREGRKFGLHFMLIGHKWAKADVGGDVRVRTAASNFLVHRFNDEGQAKLLLGSEGKNALTLQPGQYWLKGLMTGEASMVYTPDVDASAVPVVLGLAGQIVDSTIADPVADTIADGISLADLPDTGGYNRGYNVTALYKPADTTAERIQLPAELKVKVTQVLGLDAEGASQNEIIRQVWQAEANTRAGRQAADELRQIRAYIARMAATA